MYDAKLRMAELFRHVGQPERAATLRREAADAAGTGSARAFWLEKLGIFALALDGAQAPDPDRHPNAGHLLWSRVPTPEQVARRLAPGCSSPISSRAGACAR